RFCLRARAGECWRGAEACWRRRAGHARLGHSLLPKDRAARPADSCALSPGPLAGDRRARNGRRDLARPLPRFRSLARRQRRLGLRAPPPALDPLAEVLAATFTLLC